MTNNFSHLPIKPDGGYIRLDPTLAEVSFGLIGLTPSGFGQDNAAQAEVRQMNRDARSVLSPIMAMAKLISPAPHFLDGAISSHLMVRLACPDYRPLADPCDSDSVVLRKAIEEAPGIRWEEPMTTSLWRSNAVAAFAPALRQERLLSTIIEASIDHIAVLTPSQADLVRAGAGLTALLVGERLRPV